MTSPSLHQQQSHQLQHQLQHLSDAERRAFDALELKRWSAFLAAIGLFAATVIGFTGVSALRIYLRAQLEIRWRRSVTAHYLESWVSPQAYCQAELHRGEIDNPDQRIAEDVRDFVASALGLSLSLLSAVVTLLSFGGLLWTLSRHFPLELPGMELRIPGLLLWVAVLYALVSSLLTHWVGRRLVPLNVDRLRFEADFRYGLVRFRDNVAAVSLSRGEDLERLGALERFQSIMKNWRQLIAAQLNLNLLTTGVGQASNLVAPLHALGIGFISGMVVAMASRVTLGHSGHALHADQLTWLALFGVNVTAVTRVAAELLPHAYAWINLLAELAWLAVFAPWVLRYAPLYLRPRADNQPG